MGLFSKKARKFNENFLKEKGYGAAKRVEFTKFMKSIGLSYNNDKITDEIFNQYLQLKETKELQKQEENIYKVNDNFLKERDIGFIEKGSIIQFMESLNLNYRKDKITDEIFNQYLQLKETKELQKQDEKLEKKRLKEEERKQKEQEKLEKKRLKEENESISDFNKKFLKEHNIGFFERSDIKIFLKSINLDYTKNKLTEDIIEQYKLFKKDIPILKSLDNIKSKNEVRIEILKQTDKIAKMATGALVFGKTGALAYALGDDMEWISAKLLLSDFGVSISKTGEAIPYEDITKYDMISTKEFAISSKSNTMTFRINKTDADALKIILNEKIPENISIPSIQENTNNYSDSDSLLKYAELYKEGLLTKEEFEFKKSEILGMDTNSSESSNKLKSKFCPNCGAEIEITSKFCNNCGLRLKN